MNRLTIAVGLALALTSTRARAELRELKQSIYGMD
jgi:hypothetical protein